MAGISDDSWERPPSPPTKLRPPAEKKAAPRTRASPSPHRRALSPPGRPGSPPVCASAGATTVSRAKGAPSREKGTGRVLAELAELRAQLEAHARGSTARAQELTAAQLEIASLKAELRRKDGSGGAAAEPAPAALHAEVARLKQENAMVLEYLDRALEESHRHEETNQRVLQQLEAAEKRVSELQEVATRRQAQVEAAGERSADLERQLAAERRATEERDHQLQRAEEQRRAAEAALTAAHREYADLQTLQDELLDSLQAAQSELQRAGPRAPTPMLPLLPGVPPPSSPAHSLPVLPSADLARAINLNTEALQQQQAILLDFMRQMRLSDGRSGAPSGGWPASDLTLGSVGDDGPRSPDPGPRATTTSLPLTPPRVLRDAAVQCERPATVAQATQTLAGAPVASAVDNDVTAAWAEVARLQGELATQRHDHQVARGVYERELQHLREQQERQLVERVDRQCFESLQRSYELSEARGRLLNASLSLYSDLDAPGAAPLRVA